MLGTGAKKAVSDTRCCAERWMLRDRLRQARRDGVPRHAVVAWMRRKHGGAVVVWRHLADGRLGCAVPCVLCAKWLSRFDLTVTCPLDDERTWSGKLSEPTAPVPKPTSRQASKLFCRVSGQ